LRLKVAGEKLAHINITRVSGFTDAEILDIVFGKPVQEIVTELSMSMRFLTCKFWAITTRRTTANKFAALILTVMTTKAEEK
jgi:hypothetical protein